MDDMQFTGPRPMPPLSKNLFFVDRNHLVLRGIGMIKLIRTFAAQRKHGLTGTDVFLSLIHI